MLRRRSPRRPSAILSMNSRVTIGRSSCTSRWPWIRRIGFEPDFRCRSEAFRCAVSDKSCWSSICRSLLLGRLLRCRRRPSDWPEAWVVADFGLDFDQDLGIFLQVPLGVLSALTDSLTLIGVPSTGFFDNIVLRGQVQDRPLLGDALPVNDVELRLPEGRRELVLHDFDLGPDADRLGAILDGVLAPDIQPDRGVELEGPAPGGGLGGAEHDPDLLPDLVDEDDRAARARDGGGQLPEVL